MVIPMALGGVALVGGILTMSRYPILSFALVCLVAIGAFAPLGPFWAVTTEWFSRKMAGSVAGFINGVGNLGGFFGPFLVGYLNKRFGSFVPGFSMLASFMLIGAVLPFFLKPPPDPTRIPAAVGSADAA
jgi:nitrate/nitrite transporter NarK